MLKLVDHCIIVVCSWKMHKVVRNKSYMIINMFGF